MGEKGRVREADLMIHEDDCLVVWFGLCMDFSFLFCVILRYQKHGVAWTGVSGGIDR